MAISIVSVTTAGGGYPSPWCYGIGTFPLTAVNTAGNTLIVVIGWNSLAHDLAGAYRPDGSNPVASVADSAHNWWVHLGTAPAAGGMRVSVWMAANAQPVSWVSVGLSGFTTTALAHVAEVSGLPQYPVLDVAASAFTASGTSVAVNPTFAASDMAIAAMACTKAPTVTDPGLWTTIADSNVADYFGGDLASTQLRSLWATESPGAVTATWTASATTSLAGIVVGIKLASSPPVLKNPAWPALKVEAAFGYQPGDITAVPAWTDITPRTIGPSGGTSIAASRGRSYELTTTEAGTLNVLLNNQDGAFGTASSGSPYYSNALNANMSFEAGVSPWGSSNNAVLASSAAFAYTGTRSVQVTPDGVTANPGAMSEQVPVTAGQPYTASAWFYIPAGWASGGDVVINWFNSSHTYLSTSAPAPAASFPAGQWTQFVFAAAVAPAGAAYASIIPQLGATPPAATVFYVDEAALVAGSTPVATGLVKLGVPVRASAYWQGRTYPIGYGYVQKWPQTWPDLPQWGFSPMEAADGISVLANTVMPSALAGEYLIDQPYLYLPCGESYTSGDPATGKPLSNAARTNSKGAVCIDGFSRVAANQISLSTGQALGLLGDAGTGIGTSAITGGTQHYQAPGARYLDSGMLQPGRTGGLMIEFWAYVGNDINTGTKAICELLRIEGRYGNYNASVNYPSAMRLVVQANGPTGNIDMIVSGVNGASTVTATLTGDLPTPGTPPTALQFTVLIEFSSPSAGTATIYTNPFGTSGASVALTAAHNLSDWYALYLGPAHSPSGDLIYGYSYAIGHVAVFPAVLGATRRYAHYYAAGLGAYATTASTRMGELLTWGGFSVRRAASPDSPSPQLGAADQIAGQSLAQAMGAVAVADGGMFFADAAGTVTYYSRQWLYDRPAKYVFGDRPDLGEIPALPGSSYNYDNQYVYNTVTSQRSLSQNQQGAVVTLADATSKLQYFQRGVLQQNIETVADQDAYDRVNWSLAAYKQPSVRVQQIVLNPAAHPAAWPAALGVEQGDVVTYNRRPLGAPAITFTGIVQKVQHDIGPGKWQVTLLVTPYAYMSNVLRCDVAGYDAAGNNQLGW
jgi:hypothetical protein